MQRGTAVRLAGAAIAAAALAVAGCTTLGPGSVARDRFDFSAAIGESWKRQTLLNIVKLRYLDPPIFVDVGQIVAGYSLETGVDAGGTRTTDSSSLSLSGHATYTDRPTITYMPLTGNKFVKSLMTPLSTESVIFMIQSGWPADSVLYATASSINGLKNQSSTINGTTPPEPDFQRALALLRQVQLSGAVAIRVRPGDQGQPAMVFTFRSENATPEAVAAILELRKLLKLDPDASEFQLAFGETPTSNKEIAIVTRSILQLMSTLAAMVQVPEEDLADARAVPGWESVTGPVSAMRIMDIQCSDEAPTNAFVSVNYRDRWFFIDDRDLRSKRAFSFMMLLFTLSDTSDKGPAPLLTIPA